MRLYFGLLGFSGHCKLPLAILKEMNMKLTAKFLGIIALTAVIGLSMTSCDGTGGGGGGGTVGQREINVTGQPVFLLDWGTVDTTLTPLPSDDSRTVTANLDGVTASINNGRLSINMGTPDVYDLEPFSDLWVIRDMQWDWDDVTIRPNNVMAAMLELSVPNIGWSRRLWRGNETESSTTRSDSGVYERVYFIYVDADVTISAPRYQYEFSGQGWSNRSDNRAFNLTLREGWNTLLWRDEWSNTWNGVSTYSYTYILSLANPARLRWILGSW